MLRLTFLLLLLAGTVSAQTTTPDSATAAPRVAPTSAVLATAAPGRFSSADTVRALHKLFARHRRVGTILSFGMVGVNLTLAGISAANEPKTVHSGGGFGINGPIGPHDFGTYAALYSLITAPVFVVGVEQLIAYSPRHEARVITAYETNHRLSAKYQRKVRKFLR